MFDHCQLGTVQGAPLYKTPTADSPLTKLNQKGHHLYQSIDKVVYLTENMRLTQDPEWGAMLGDARLGKWTQAIRSCIFSSPDIASINIRTRDKIIPIISTDNATRVDVNETALQTAVQTFGDTRKVYVFSAQLTQQLSPYELALIRTLPDNKTGHIPLFSHVDIGMPVRIKSNQCVLKGVVNGATGVIHHIDWPPRTEFNLQPNYTWLASCQPNNIYVQLNHGASSESFPNIPID